MNHLENKGPEYDFYGKLSLKKAIPLGLQHVLAMFVGNLDRKSTRLNSSHP